MKQITCTDCDGTDFEQTGEDQTQLTLCCLNCGEEHTVNIVRGP